MLNQIYMNVVISFIISFSISYFYLRKFNFNFICYITTIFILSFVILYYLGPKDEHELFANSKNDVEGFETGATMTGRYVTPKNVPIESIKLLNDNKTKVYMIYQSGYIKMVTGGGDARYVRTTGLDDFSADKWDTYKTAGKNYVLNSAKMNKINPYFYNENPGSSTKCMKECEKVRQCNAYTYDNSDKSCDLYNTIPNKFKEEYGVVSGYKTNNKSFDANELN